MPSILNVKDEKNAKIFRQIKLSVFIFFVFFAFISQPVCAQQPELKQPVSLNFQQKPLYEVFVLITQQTGLRFSYNSQQVNANRKVSIRVENRELGKVLPMILPSTVTSKQVGKYIILSVPESIKKITHADSNTSPKSLLIENKSDSIVLIDSAKVLFSLKISSLNNGILLDSCHRVITPIKEEEMNRKLALLALSATIAGSSMVAQTEQPEVLKTKSEELKSVRNEESETLAEPAIHEKRAAQVAFVYPLGIDGVNTANNEYNASFNIIGGKTGKVNAFEIASIFNMNRYCSTGFQMAGIFNHAGTVESSAQSNNVQFAGIFNTTLRGNSTQVAGIYNIADRASVQFSGITNQAGHAGAQFSGIVNKANSSACQFSLINITGKGRFQAGLVNVRDTADGVSIGLVNVVKKGGLMEVEVGGNDATQITASFRSGTQKLYSIFAVGYNSSDKFLSTGFGFGTEITLKNRWRLNLEGVHYNLYNKDSFKYDDDSADEIEDWDDFESWWSEVDHDDFHYASLTQLRATINFKVAEHFKIYAGPTFNLSIVDKDFKFSAPYSIWSASGNHVNLKTWVGYTAGLRF